jgi:hypothetical protein
MLLSQKPQLGSTGRWSFGRKCDVKPRFLRVLVEVEIMSSVPHLGSVLEANQRAVSRYCPYAFAACKSDTALNMGPGENDTSRSSTEIARAYSHI